MKKQLYLFSGLLATALGIAGIFLPLLPTTPFLLLAAFCFGRSSPKLAGYLERNRYLGYYLANYRSGSGVPFQVKAQSLGFLWVMLGLAAFVHCGIWYWLLLLAVALGVSTHILLLKTRRGEVPEFTLIELLVAVTIIGILASLLIPSLNGARLRSLDSSCRNNLRQLGMANQLYAGENTDYFVPYSRHSPHASGPIWLGYQDVAAGSVYGRVDLTCDALLGGYYGGSPQVAICPEMRKFIPDLRRAASGGGYGYNGVWLGGFPVRGTAHFYKTTMIYAPAATVMFGDAAISQMGSIPLDPPLRLPLLNGKFEADAFGGGGDGFGTVHARHREAANIGWTDGHVTSAKLGYVNANASSQRNLIGHVGDRTTDLYRILKPIAPPAALGLR